MSIKLIADENIPNSVIEKLREQGYEILSIRETNKGIEDQNIIQLSKDIELPILTMDKDFGYLTYHLNQVPFGVILIRIHPQSPEIIYSTISSVLNQISKQKIDLKNKFIVSDGKTLRIREIQ